MYRELALFLAVLFAAASVSAIGVDVPGNIYVYSEPKEVNVTISNDSAYDRQLDVEFFCPLDYEFSGLASTIEAGSTETFKIKLSPSSALEGSNYSATLVVSLDGERTEKVVDIFVRGEIPPAQPAPSAPFTGFASVFQLPSLAGLLNFEFALDIVLVLVAAILLIAFISRLVKRYGVRQ